MCILSHKSLTVRIYFDSSKQNDERRLFVKNEVTPFIVNVTRLYMIADIMKIKLVIECCHAISCSDISTNNSPNFTIGFIDNQC